MVPVRALTVFFNTPVDFVILDGMYGNFAGRDASRGMAKQSFDTGTPCDLSIISSLLI